MVLQKVIGSQRYGALNYWRRPWDGRAWGGPFNGQGWRCRLVAELILKAEPTSIVETGTYLGTTTEWLSAFQLPVYSCDVSEYNFGFSSRRLGNIPNIHLTLGDSRVALRNILAGPLRSKTAEPIFFYLDAHWNEDLPLREEFDIIFEACPRAIVLVDDYEVPDDPEYSFDDYGAGKALDAAYAAPSMATHGLSMYSPHRRAADETGARRGCAVFVQRAAMEDVLGGVALLRLARTK